MSATLSITRRELGAYFNTPIVSAEQFRREARRGDSRQSSATGAARILTSPPLRVAEQLCQLFDYLVRATSKPSNGVLHGFKTNECLNKLIGRK